MSQQSTAAMRLVKRAAPVFHGQDPHIVGAALAELLARLLAGHIVPDNRAETDRLRGELLDLHIKTVRDLIEVNHNQVHGPWPKPN